MPPHTVAIDLDETLATPVLSPEGQFIEFQWRPGALGLLEVLSKQYILVLWSVAPRIHVERALNQGLKAYFDRAISWDEWPKSFKDIQKVGVDWLIDDSLEHKEKAQSLGLEARYIVVPGIGSKEDVEDECAWLHVVHQALGV